ncbi:hypothetical protein ABPG75_012148 [Micractinium tetrahymenae]
MASGVVSLGCGHLFHEACLTGGELRHCALCRAPVRPDRIKSASQVPGAHTPSGTIQENWALRSLGLQPMLHQPPAVPGVLDSGAASEHRSRRPRSGGARPATDIPPLDSAALLEGIRLQLGAAAVADGGASAGQAGAAQQPGTYAFCIDVSSSMGSSRAWQPAAVSRLCFALATLACVVDSQVAEGSWVMVAGFDAELAVLKPWFRKPASFDMAAFLAECTGAVRHSGLRRWGTRLCAALRRVVTDQAAQVRALASAAAARHPPGFPAPPGAAPRAVQHSFVLLTDGDADDGGTGLEAAAALVRDPPFEHGGFRALLMHIDFRLGRNRDWLRRLAAGADGRRLPFVELLELALPARLNLSSLHSAGSASLSQRLSGLSALSGATAGSSDLLGELCPGGSVPMGWPGQQRVQQAGWGQAQPRWAQAAADWRRAGQHAADGRRAGQHAADGRRAGQHAADGRRTGQHAADGRRGDQPRGEGDDSMPVRAMSRAIHAFSSTLGSAPSMRAQRDWRLDGAGGLPVVAGGVAWA